MAVPQVSPQQSPGEPCGHRGHLQPRQRLVVLEEKLGQGVQLVAVQPSAGTEEKGQGWEYKAMTPSAAQLDAPRRAGYFGSLQEANRAEHPTWQGQPHPAHHNPRQGQPRGTNRPTHNVVITCREDSKLLTADCCLTPLLTCCSAQLLIFARAAWDF